MYVYAPLLLAIASSAQWAERASATFDELQSSFWNETVGLWRSSMWWQSANTVEVLANLGKYVPSTEPSVAHVLAVVFNSTSNETIARCDGRVDLTYSGYFDDELWWGIGWLRAHALTGEFKYLNRSRHIFEDVAQRAWYNGSCHGGVCWQATADPGDMGRCYKNAITNELFLSLGASLSSTYARRCQDARARSGSDAAAADCAAATHTATWAQAELDWFLRSGMINGSSLVNDGLDTFDNHREVCLNNRHTAYTYNQGVLLSGLGLLWSARKQSAAPTRGRLAREVAVATVDGLVTTSAGAPEDLLQVAASIVEAVWASSLVYHGSGGVLREMGEPELMHGTLPNLYEGSPGTDGLMFKSVLIRHLRYLIETVIETAGSEEAAQAAIATAGGNLTEWRQRIAVNAATIWQNAACVRAIPNEVGATVAVPPLFGYLWRGPCSWAFGGPSATTQTSALDVFISAIA